MYKVILVNGLSYYDQKTNTLLQRTDPDRKSRTFSDEFIEEHNMSQIEFSVKVGTLKKVNIEKEVVQSEEEDIEIQFEEEVSTPEEDADIELEELTDEGELRCQKIKSNGKQCDFSAKYPEDNPEFCGIHKE